MRCEAESSILMKCRTSSANLNKPEGQQRPDLTSNSNRLCDRALSEQKTDMCYMYTAFSDAVAQHESVNRIKDRSTHQFLIHQIIWHWFNITASKQLYVFVVCLFHCDCWLMLHDVKNQNIISEVCYYWMLNEHWRWWIHRWSQVDASSKQWLTVSHTFWQHLVRYVMTYLRKQIYWGYFLHFSLKCSVVAAHFYIWELSSKKYLFGFSWLRRLHMAAKLNKLRMPHTSSSHCHMSV